MLFSTLSERFIYPVHSLFIIFFLWCYMLCTKYQKKEYSRINNSRDVEGFFTCCIDKINDNEEDLGFILTRKKRFFGENNKIRCMAFERIVSVQQT